MLYRPRLFSLGEEVRNQPVLDVLSEGAEDVARLGVAAGDERQPLQADHRVAAPVGEPVVAGDDRSGLIAVGVGAGGIGDAGNRRDDELVGGKDQFRGEPSSGSRNRLVVQPPPAIHFRLERLLR